MNLADQELRYKNPGTNQDLVIGIKMVSPVSREEMARNLKINQMRDVSWLKECPAHDGVAIICGAGPSIEDTLEEIRGIDGTIFACNSAAHYLLNNGFDVDYQVMLDPYPVREVDYAPAKHHLLASIVDPKMFEMAQDVTLWQPCMDWIEELIRPDCPEFVYIGGGVTVANSAICIAYTMGYRKFHIFGMDSSFRDNKTHVKDVPEFGAFYVRVKENGKEYETAYDMKEQARVFLGMREYLKSIGCIIKVYGSGLLPDTVRRIESASDSQTQLLEVNNA